MEGTESQTLLALFICGISKSTVHRADKRMGNQGREWEGGSLIDNYENTISTKYEE